MVSFRQMKDAEKRALRRLDTGTWLRRPGGWEQPGAPSIALATGEALINMSLAVKAGDHLRITPYGRATLDKLIAKQGAGQ